MSGLNVRATRRTQLKQDSNKSLFKWRRYEPAIILSRVSNGTADTVDNLRLNEYCCSLFNLTGATPWSTNPLTFVGAFGRRRIYGSFTK
jgi:hypothetical protein